MDLPAYDEKQALEDMEYIAKKLGVSVEEFKEIISGENKTYRDYKNSFGVLRIGIKLAMLLVIEKINFR